MADDILARTKREDVKNLSLLGDEVMRGKIRQRGAKRGQVTKFLLKINVTGYSHPDFLFVLEKLKGYKESLKALDTEVEVYMLTGKQWSDAHYLEQCELVEHYQDELDIAIINLTNAMENNVSSQKLNNNVNTAKLQLPHIELPKFNSEPENYNQFIVSFEQSISNFNLSQYEKYSLLLKQVSGSARSIVQSIDHGPSDYDSALELLNGAFSDTTVQQFSVISKICKLKLSGDPFQWISEARSLTDQIDRLKIDGNMFLQYFLWNGIPDNFKSQFISVTGNSKPSLTEILNNSFEVFNRVKQIPVESTNNRERPVRSIAMATETSNSDNYTRSDNKSNFTSECALCSYMNKPSDHKVYYCTNFKTPDDKLKVIEGAIMDVCVVAD